jgi:hypothetical protein
MIEGERKHVTVLFCDMEDLTPLVEKRDSEKAYPDLRGLQPLQPPSSLKLGPIGGAFSGIRIRPDAGDRVFGSRQQMPPGILQEDSVALPEPIAAVLYKRLTYSIETACDPVVSTYE